MIPIPLITGVKLAGGWVLKNWRVFVVIGLVVAYTGFWYVTGRNHERGDQQKRAAKAAQLAAKETQRLVEKNYSITVATGEVLERERVITQTIIREIPRHVPTNACPVDSGVRVVHDAAAAGEDPAARSRSDAAPVEARTFAETIAINYGRCRGDQARLVKLQQYVRDICRPDGLEPTTVELEAKQE